MEDTRLITCANLDEAYGWGLRHVLETGYRVSPRGASTIEVNDCAIRLLDPRARIVTIPERKWSLPYAFGETIWHFAGSNQLDFISYYARRWRRFSDDGITVTGSCYGHKIFTQSQNLQSQWEYVKRLLGMDPDTRRGVITISQHEDLIMPDSRDIPCCNLLQFLIRDGRLCLIVYMRSNDLMFGFTYDVFLFTMLQERMSLELGVPLGWYQHVVGSLHVYENDLPWAEAIARGRGRAGSQTMPQMKALHELPPAFEYERAIRATKNVTWDFEFDLSPYWHDIAVVLLFHRLTRTGDYLGARAAANRLSSTPYNALLSESCTSIESEHTAR